MDLVSIREANEVCRGEYLFYSCPKTNIGKWREYIFGINFHYVCDIALCSTLFYEWHGGSHCIWNMHLGRHESSVFLVGV